MTPTEEFLKEIDDFSSKQSSNLISKEKLTTAILLKHNEYINSGKTLKEWLNDWKILRGGTEEFRIPEDMVLEFYIQRSN